MPAPLSPKQYSPSAIASRLAIDSPAITCYALLWNAQRCLPTETIRSPPGDPRSHGPQNPGCLGTATRLRHRPPHRAVEPGSAAIERGDGVHRLAAPPPAGLDYFRMGRIGKQSPGAFLFDYAERSKA